MGIAQNKRLNEITAQWQQAAEKQYAISGEKVRWFGEFHYAARSWQQLRRIIVKIGHTEKGTHPRYVVTNLTGKLQLFYDKLLFSTR